MESKMEQFREFVTRYSKVRDDVRSGKRTWQNIYEEWVLYGENDPQWQPYLTDKKTDKETKPNNLSINMDSVKNVMGYIKKINPDSMNKTLNTVQKVIQIAQTVGGAKGGTAPIFSSAYSDWWD